MKTLNAVSEAKSLASLDLSQRTLNAFTAIGVTTIRQLINGGRDSLTQLCVGAKKTTAEVDEALCALALSITPAGDVDWIAYANRRGFLIVPEVAKAAWSAYEFLEALPHVAEAIVKHRYGDRGLIVLKGRLLRYAQDCMSLESVGKRLGLTKQAVQLIEAELSNVFRNTMRYDEYRGCKFRIRPQFVQTMLDLVSVFDLLSKRSYSHSQWLQIVTETWGAEAEQLASTEHLLLEIVGLKLRVIKGAGEQTTFLCLPQNAQSVRMALGEIQRLLTCRSPRGLLPEELHQALQMKLGPHSSILQELPELMRLLPRFEINEASGRYRTRSSGLSSCSLYETILVEAGKPLHFHDIWRAASRTCNDRNILLQTVRSGLSGDSRFVALSRPGFWGLAEWPNLETRTIEEVAAELLSSSKVPMTEQALFDVIATHRPIKKRSIGTQLGRDVRFERAAPKTWKLAAKSEACRHV